MFIGIAGTIPNLPNLPGQGGGGGVEVLLEYDSSSFCKVTNPNLVLPTVAEPAGGTFSYTGTGTLGIVPYTGLINIADSDSGSYTITYSVGGSSSDFPIAIGNEIILSITTSPGATICTGDTATLTANASGGSGGFTYSWSTGATSQSIDVTTSGNYIVTVTDSDGCSVSAVQQITASTAATTIASINNDAAMSFNGTDTYVQMGENLPNLHDNARTLVFWAKATSWTASQGVVIESDAFEMTVVVGYSSQYVSFTTDSDVNNNQRKTWSASGLTDNTWHHFAMTVDSSNNISDIYVDGVAQTVSSIAGFAQSTGINNIGKRFNNSSYFNGELDEIAVFNSKLSSCDIKGIYEGSIGSNAGKAANLLDANTTIPAPVYWNRMGDS
jgi:hypothetical protein